MTDFSNEEEVKKYCDSHIRTIVFFTENVLSNYQNDCDDPEILLDMVMNTMTNVFTHITLKVFSSIIIQGDQMGFKKAVLDQSLRSIEKLVLGKILN